MSDSWRDSEGQVIDGQFPLVKFKAATDHSVVFSTLRGKDKNEKAAIKFIQADASNAKRNSRDGSRRLSSLTPI